MRIGRQAAALLQFAAEVDKLGLGEAALDEGSGVHTGGGVALKVNLVARVSVVRSAEKVVVADLVEGGRRSEGRNVPTGSGFVAIGAGDHGHGVPAHDILDPALDFAAPWVGWLLFATDGVEVGGVGAVGLGHAGFGGTALELVQEVLNLLGRAVGQYIVEGFEPLVYFCL